MHLKLGTRKSDLARWQAKHVAGLIAAVAPDVEISIVLVSSIGDKDRKSEFQAFGGVGAFTKESEDALIAGEVDFVVHSLKDLPTKLPPELVLAAVPEREDPRDALIGVTLAELKAGVRVGTGSIRRKAQLLAICPELDIKPIRGNVPPRLRKAKNREGIDATLLAAAGLTRLGLIDEATEVLDPAVFPYAVAQGALGIEARKADTAILEILKRIEHAPSRAEADAERALMRRLEAGCSLPVGVAAVWSGDRLTLHGQVTHPDGSEVVKAVAEGTAATAEAIGNDLGDKLLALGAGPLLRAHQPHAEMLAAG